MKKVTKFFMAALLAGMCNFYYAQNEPDYLKAPKPDETQVDFIRSEIYAGYFEYCDNKVDVTAVNTTVSYNEEELYNKLLALAKNKYAELYPSFALRKFQSDLDHREYNTKYCAGSKEYYIVSAIVVIKDIKKLVSTAMNKALRDVPEGSRIAFDRVTSSNEEIDRDELKDQVTDMLLDRGYRIVAKEYFAKLYQEQQDQQSGIYNENTTVRENNLSAVGYYINVKVTETSLRVQVVNVSTGEYEGNATVNF